MYNLKLLILIKIWMQQNIEDIIAILMQFKFSRILFLEDKDSNFIEIQIETAISLIREEDGENLCWSESETGIIIGKRIFSVESGRQSYLSRHPNLSHFFLLFRY